jgi:hypothetical protein
MRLLSCLPLALLVKKIMKQIKFRLSDDEYLLAEVNAQAQGFDSISSYAKSKALELKNANALSKKITVTNEPTKRAWVYLYDHEVELIKRHAVLSGLSMSREIAFRVRQTLMKNDPCFYLEEMNDLKRMRTEINRVGRNIHLIIALERFLQVNDDGFRSEINELLRAISKLESTLKSLVQSAINRFG